MKKNITPKEDHECISFANYLCFLGLKFAHIANERNTSIQHAMKLKAMGVSKGFPDYLVLIPAERSKLNKTIMLFIEMKRTVGGSTSKEQKDWLDALNCVENVQGFVCKGFLAAKEIIELYLKI